jgi:hypothetical protein
MTNGETNRSAFRCAVLPEQSAARLRLGMTSRPVRVTDTSREAFTLDVDYATFRRLAEGRRATLEYQGETWDVVCTATFQLMDQQYHVSLARVRDRTRVRGPKTTFWSLLPTTNAAASPALPLALLLSFLFACVALPGMGDSLGTAPKIRKIVQDIWHRATGG